MEGLYKTTDKIDPDRNHWSSSCGNIYFTSISKCYCFMYDAGTVMVVIV